MSRLTIPLLAGAALLSGCAAIPDMGPKPSLLGPDTLKVAVATPQQGNASPATDDSWWTRYGDPQLNGLVAQALSQSPTLVEANARLRAAAARADQSLANTRPTLTANGQAFETKQSYNAGFPKLFVPKGYKDFGRTSLDLGYDLDLWGRNRAALAAATSEAEAAAADAAQAKLILTTSLVIAYADFARVTAELKAAEASVQNRQASADLVGRQLANGAANRGEAQQAAAAAATARSDLAALQEQSNLMRNRIAALVGASPELSSTLVVPIAASGREVSLSTKLDANLIGRRPDLMAARLRVTAAAKRIDVAKAGFYPNINLAAYLGVQSLGLDMLSKSGSDIGQAGLALSLPIFEAGRLQAGYRGTQADYDGAVAAYNQALVLALKDVADAVNGTRSLATQVAAAREALASGEVAYRIARLRYEGGLSSYLVLLTAENAVIAQRRAVAQLEARALSLDASLTRALGGDFRS
ncbi:MAG: efflux transporter outer membrane subunit [Alphaproteobacteria bacterium]